MKILVSDPNSKIGLAVIRSLKMSKYHVEMFSHHKKTLCYYSKFCKKIHILPDYRNPNFEKKFINLIKMQKFDYIIPVQYKSFYYLSKIKKKILKYSKINCESHYNISKVSSKLFMKNLSSKIKINFLKNIKTLQISNFKLVKKKLKNIEYPIVIKPKLEQGGSSNHVFYANNEIDVFKILNKISKKLKLNIKDFIIQTKISGKGRGFFSVSKKGECSSFFQHERIREFPITGGRSVAAKSIYDKKLSKIGKSIIKKLRWNGVMMLEFKYYNNDYYLIEANPKFWGSLDLAVASGVNFPTDLINQKKLKNNKQFYKIGLKYHWPFDGDLRVSIKSLRLFYSFIFDMLSPFCKSNVWFLKDPIVSFYMVFKFFKNILIIDK